MYSLTTFYNVKMQLIKDIEHCRDGIDFYLASHDQVEANRLENRIKSLITRFNIMFNYNFQEGERLFL